MTGPSCLTKSPSSQSWGSNKSPPTYSRTIGSCLKTTSMATTHDWAVKSLTAIKCRHMTWGQATLKSLNNLSYDHTLLFILLLYQGLMLFYTCNTFYLANRLLKEICAGFSVRWRSCNEVYIWLIGWPFRISQNWKIVYQSNKEVCLYLCKKWGQILVSAVFTNTTCFHSLSKQFSHVIQLFHLKSEKFVHQHCIAVERKSTC